MKGVILAAMLAVVTLCGCATTAHSPYAQTIDGVTYDPTARSNMAGHIFASGVVVGFVGLLALTVYVLPPLDDALVEATGCEEPMWHCAKPGEDGQEEPFFVRPEWFPLY